MPTTMDPLLIRRRLGKRLWSPPTEYGPDGWRYQSIGLVAADEQPAESEYQIVGEILVSCCDWDGDDWLHASIARPWMPTYDDLVLLHKGVFGDGYAYQVFAPPDQHINLNNHVLHLWGRADSKPALPEFGAYGTI